MNWSAQGLHLAPDFLSPEEASQLLDKLDVEPWDAALSRRVQHYGHRYNYKARQVGGPLGPMPGWLAPLCFRMVQDAGFDRPAEQVIVNEYLPGQGIGSHTDSAAFGPSVASLSLGSGIVMVLQGQGPGRLELYLPPRSLLVLSGPARATWRHGIASRKMDPGYGPRGRRVSLTFRTRA